jgi:hypothetical protein
MPADLAVALALADIADALALPAFDGGAAAVAKADGTPVTAFDHEVERALRERLAADRPADAILGEELGSVGEGERRWVLDPLDGTEWFARGIPVWGTLNVPADEVGWVSRSRTRAARSSQSSPPRRCGAAGGPHEGRARSATAGRSRCRRSRRWRTRSWRTRTSTWALRSTPTRCCARRG